MSVSSLFFKELSTLNLTMLLNLTTGQGGQTIHKMDVRYRIIICDKLKQAKPGRHLEPTDLFAYPNDNNLCVVEHLSKGHSKLLLSHVQPFKPVSKDTMHFQVD